MKKIPKIGSLLIGIGLGIIIGIYINSLMLTTYNLFPYMNLVIIGILAILFFVFAYSKPIFVELLAYTICIYIIFQYIWDAVGSNVSSTKLTLFIAAIILLLINIFTGYIKFIGAKNTAKRAIGLE